MLCLPGQSTGFPYRYLPPITIAPTEEASCMFFDKEGMMWVGTNAGVKSYDGYHVKTYKTNAYQPGILPNNTIRSIAEDHQDNLWLGTRNGLVRMNKRTGKFKTFFLPDESQRIIYTLFVSKMELYGLELMADFPTSIPRQRRSIPIIIRMHGSLMRMAAERKCPAIA